MTTTEYIAISKTGTTPAFKQLIGLKPRGNTDILRDFCSFAHPNGTKYAKDNKVEVFTDKAHYVYSLYEGVIQRKNLATRQETMFKY